MLDVLTTALSQSAKRNHDEPLTSSIRNVRQKLPMAVPAATNPPQESNVQTPEQEPMGRDAILTFSLKSKAIFVMAQRKGGFAVAMARKAKQSTPWLATSDGRDSSGHTVKRVAKELGDYLCAVSYQMPAIAADMVMAMLYRNANYPVLEMVRTRLAEDTPSRNQDSAIVDGLNDFAQHHAPVRRTDKVQAALNAVSTAAAFSFNDPVSQLAKRIGISRETAAISRSQALQMRQDNAPYEAKKWTQRSDCMRSASTTDDVETASVEACGEQVPF